MHLFSRRLAVLYLTLLCCCYRESAAPDITDTAVTDSMAADTVTIATDTFTLPTGRPIDSPALRAALNMPLSFTVLADDGSEVKLTPDANTIITQIATWCPYSKKYVEFLRDPEAQALLDEKKFLFLLEKSEWPKVREKLVEQSPNATREQIDQQLEELKEEAGYAPVYQPAVLETLPGQYYFIPPNSSIKGESFPEAYDPIAGKCNKHPADVLQELPVDQNRLAEIWSRHHGKKTS